MWRALREGPGVPAERSAVSLSWRSLVVPLAGVALVATLAYGLLYEPEVRGFCIGRRMQSDGTEVCGALPVGTAQPEDPTAGLSGS